MNRLFSKIGKLIEKSPFKVLLASLLVFAIMITGAIKINMATGDETLVQTSSEAYISNHNMQKEFGGDPIMVLLKGDKEELLSQENIEKMWNVEERLKYSDGIYSFLSPASIVHQIADRQAGEIKKNIPDISDGLGEMSEKLIEVGTELGNKDVPDPEAIEGKLDELMASMDPSSAMEDMLAGQEAEMAKMNEQVATMGGGLNEIGTRLVGVGRELKSKDVPDPAQTEKKLDGLMASMDPDKLVDETLKDQEAEMDAMEEKVGEMSSKLSQMGNGLVEIGSNLGSMDSPDMGVIEEKLGALEDISGVFDGLIDGQDNLEAGIGELGQGLTASSDGLGQLAGQLEAMAGQTDDPQMKEQLNQLSQQVSQSSQALGTMSANTDELKGAPANTSQALNGIKTNLQEEIQEMKASLPGDIPAGDLKEVSARLTEMGNGLNQISANISSLPDEISGSLGEAPSKMLSGMMANIEKEIGGMKESLSGGIDPEELETMANGFITMGQKLQEMSAGLSNLPEKMGEALSGAQDPSLIFSDMTSQIEAEVGAMKENLTGGIDPEELETMADGFVVMGENLEELSEGLETFYEKSPMMLANIPQSQEELDNILYEDGKLRDMFSDVVIDDEHIMMMVKLDGNLEDDAKDALYLDVAEAMEAEGFGEEGLAAEAIEDEDVEGGGIEYVISGKPVLDSSLREEMKSNMKYMVVSAAIVMTLVLFLVFKVRWRILSIGIILVAVIGTLGLMGHLSVPMTMVSMAVFPILIGLGIDFSIQFHNRYEEELSTRRTLTQTGRAVAIAVLASMLGFISLYISPVPMIQDFGKMLTIGVVVSFLASIFLLLPILNIRDKQVSNKKDLSSAKNSSSADKDDGGLLGRVLGKTAKLVTSLPMLVLAIAVVLAGLGLFADSKVGVETDIETFMPQDMEALKDIRYVRDVAGSTDEIVIYMEDENILSKSNVSWIQAKTRDIKSKYSGEIDDVKTIDNLVDNISDGSDLSYQEYIDLVDDLPESQRSMFVNEEETKGAIILKIKHMDTERLEIFVADLRNDLDDAPMEATVTGQSVLDIEMVEGLTAGRVKMTLLGIALVFLGLLAFYRNIFKAMIPVIPVILIVGMSGGIMYLLGLNYTPITATLGALILGMGTETTLMILERYLEEREGGKSKAQALNTTVTRIGKATLSTELTTMGGFAVLIFSNFVILKDFGLMTVINVSLVLVSTFVVLPAVIWLLDKFIIKDTKEEN